MKQNKDENMNIEFLNYIYQNAQMGVIGIDHIENKIEDTDLKEEIRREKDEYESICNEAIEIYIRYGKEEKEIGKMAEMSSYMMSKMKTMMDSSTTNLAKMMMEGNNKGIIEITEKLNHYDDADEEIVALAKKLLQTEQNNLENLKEYL